MRNYIDAKDLSAQIKAGLQVCQKVLNKGKQPEIEYRLFNSLAESYLLKEKAREYPKVVAIYQYIKKLTEAYLNGDQEKLALIDRKIKAVESRFLGKVLRSDIKNKEQEVTDIGSYKEELAKFREEIKKELVDIEDLGIEKDKEELNEEGLQKRAQEVERIYIGIREFFIGKRNEAGGLEKPGIVNRLINDCIAQLGGLPRIGTDKHEWTYAVFGMGSMALGTMTLWSDLEFGVLIEDGLSKDEEERVKEYFRNLTSLLHIKVVNFGESPLRMMGVVELNNFKVTEKSDSEYNWFFDDLISSGFSFDGPHWHACKTPLGRAKGYQKARVKESGMEFIPCMPYELIGTIKEFTGFYQDTTWVKEDSQLAQGMGHIALISGHDALILQYHEMLRGQRKVIESLAFKLLKEDEQELDPFKQIFDAEKEGQILKVKKDIYRFPDRMVVALVDCLGGDGISSWELIRTAKNFGNKHQQDLQIALSIATELRLRTYVSNNGQREDLSALARYESQIKELRNKELTEEVFYLKDIRALYRYYYIVAELSIRIKNVGDKHSLIETNKIIITKAQSIIIRGYIYKRFLRPYAAIKEFESLDKNDTPSNYLAEVYEEVGRHEEALKYKQESLEMNRRIYKGDHTNIAISLNNIGNTLARLGRYEEALKYQQENVEMKRRIYKGDHSDIAGSLNNKGNALQSLGRYEEALKHNQESLEMRRRIYKGDHADVAVFLNNIGNTLQSLGRFEEALKYQQESLEMRRRIYKGEHADVAASLNNKGNALAILGRYEEALKYQQESLEMSRRIYKGDHTSIADSLNNIGATLESLGRYDEALKYYQESLEMRRRIYKGDHADVAASLNNKGNALQSLGRYEEALKYQQESLEMTRRVYKGDHVGITVSLNNKGNALAILGRYEEALKYQQESLEMKRRIYNGDHASIAGSLNSIGGTLESLGKYDEELKFKQESLEMRRKIYKGDHADVAASLNSIGDILERLGRYDEALKCQQESLGMKKRIYKDDHASIAGSLNSIGIILRSLGRYEEALKYQQESLEMRRKIYKGDHADIAGSLNNIGHTFLENLGRYEEALKYHQESLEMRRRIYKGEHADVAASLDNVGNTLRSLGRYEEALKYQQESLKMMRKIYKGDHAEIAGSLYNIGPTLENLGRYEEALKCDQESLEMRRRIYKGDHDEIAGSLNSLSIILQSLERFGEALQCALQSTNMLQRVLPPKHPYIQMTQRQFLTCTVLLANQEILSGNFDKALEYYKTINTSIKIEDLRKVIYSFTSRPWQTNLNLTISCYEVLSEKLAPQDRAIKRNLACAYHVKVFEERSKNRIRDYQKYIEKAKETFDKALNLESNKKIRASLYVEYAMFLLMHHDSKNAVEYSIIIANVMYAIELKEDGSGLSYSQVEKPTTVAPLQELLNRQKEITVKPYLLAYYLLIKAHCLHNNEEQAKETLEGLITEVQILKGAKDKELAQYLLDWCQRELESQKLQQVVISHLTDLFESGNYAMAERRKITTVILSQSLSHNHIGIIWDYYSEHKIMCVLKHELRQIFNSILSSSSEVLRAALSQNDKHVDIVMSYLDEEIMLSENFETRVITARTENKEVMKNL